jgi:alkylation response protein AidB-like acyl-CoA dehydrogenase
MAETSPILAQLTDDERALLDRAAQFRRDYVAPRAAQWERERRVPPDAFRAASAAGLIGIEVPRALGGQGGRFIAKALVAEELSRACMAFAFSLINADGAAARLAKFGSPGQIDKYLGRLIAGEATGCSALTEPGAGSDFPAIATTARRDGDGWILDGEKAWITNAVTAESVLVYAQTDRAKGYNGIAAFLIDTRLPGFERLPGFALVGGHAIGAGGFRLHQYRAAAADLFMPPGEAFKRALASINGARAYVATMCCGMVAESLRIALDYATRRKTFGKRLLDHQGLRWRFADIATDLEAARHLAYHASWLVSRGEDAILAAAQAKKFAAEMAQRRLGDCLQLMGAEGLREHYPIGRHIASARIAGFVDGSTEIQNERIGALLERTYL